MSSNDKKTTDEPTLADVMQAVQAVAADMTDMKGRVEQLEAQRELAATAPPVLTPAQEDGIRAAERRKDEWERKLIEKQEAADAKLKRGFYQWEVSIPGSHKLIVGTDTPHNHEATYKYAQHCGIRSTSSAYETKLLNPPAEQNELRQPGMPELASATR